MLGGTRSFDARQKRDIGADEVLWRQQDLERLDGEFNWRQRIGVCRSGMSTKLGARLTTKEEKGSMPIFAPKN